MRLKLNAPGKQKDYPDASFMNTLPHGAFCSNPLCKEKPEMRYDYTKVAKALAAEGLALVKIETSSVSVAILTVQELGPPTLPMGFLSEHVIDAIFPPPETLEEAITRLRQAWPARETRAAQWK